MYFPLTRMLIQYFMAVGRYCNSVSVKEAIKAHRNCIIFSNPEHTTVMEDYWLRQQSWSQVYKGQTHYQSHYLLLSRSKSSKSDDELSS